LTIISDIEISIVSIYDFIGRNVYKKPYQETALDVSSLSAGTYVVKIEKATGIESFKISIIR
jgi:hypothetical protein